MRRQIPLASRREHLLGLAATFLGMAADPSKTRPAADLARDLTDLSSPDRDRRGSAAVRLGRRGSKAASAVPKLAQTALTDPSSDVRGYAASALGAIGPAAEPGVEALARLTTDPEPAVARRAIVAIGEIGPRAVKALPGLRRRLADPDPNFRRIAARALAGLGEKAEPAADELISRMFNDDDLVVCREAAHALGTIGRPISRVVPALAEMIADDEAAPSTRFAAVTALGQIGPSAKSALGPLKEVADDPDANLASAARRALAAVSR
jgi:HEAT repeat protein